MSILRTVFVELDRPDDQGLDWYGWCSNQLSHAFLGVIVALYFPGAAVQMAVIFAALKEVTDLWRKHDRATLIDSAQDIAFWALGAWVVTAGQFLTVAVILTIFALICGIIPRVRKAVRQAKGGGF